MTNPFITSGYAGAEYFCDRVEETRKLVQFLTNGNNVALMSPRRIGKTDLIHHCFSQKEISEHYYTFVIDIYATNSLRDFVNVFGEAILSVLRSKGRKTWETFLAALSSLRSEISFDMNGNPVWGLGLGAISNPSVTLDEIFRYLSAADKPCLVAIDEFQQITKYDDGSKVEATLRTYIQRCPNAHFIFSGSHRHLMGEIFTSASRPFFQSVIIFNLHPIPLEKYRAFAQEKFSVYGKWLQPEVVDNLYQRFDSITYYLQRVLNYLFMVTPVGGEATVDMIDSVVGSILDDSSDTYQSLLIQMPEKQRMVFQAIAKAGKATSVSGAEFVKKYHLQSASTVLSAIRGLLDKDFITREGNTYMVYDRFFALWLLR